MSDTDTLEGLVTELRQQDEPIMIRAAEMLERMDRLTNSLANQLATAIRRNARIMAIVQKQLPIDQLLVALQTLKDEP